MLFNARAGKRMVDMGILLHALFWPIRWPFAMLRFAIEWKQDGYNNEYPLMEFFMAIVGELVAFFILALLGDLVSWITLLFAYIGAVIFILGHWNIADDRNETLLLGYMLQGFLFTAFWVSLVKVLTMAYLMQ